MRDLIEPAAVHEAQAEGETRRCPEAINQAPPSSRPPRGKNAAAKGAETPEGHPPQPGEAEAPDLRFADPLVATIVETWRARTDMVRAQQKLTLQIKAIGRRFCAGDKDAAQKLYTAHTKGEGLPAFALATAPLFAARLPLEEARKGYEKTLAKLGKQLPIAHMADQIRGINHTTLATIVGECGDLSQYKSVAAVWKRAGLAVIDGGRQRRVAGDAALLHGYAPERRSVMWNVAAALFKAQSTGEAPGPYRLLYDERKALELAKELTAGHAHNRALRHITKRLLRDLTVEWRRVSSATAQEPAE